MQQILLATPVSVIIILTINSVVFLLLEELR